MPERELDIGDLLLRRHDAGLIAAMQQAGTDNRREERDDRDHHEHFDQGDAGSGVLLLCS